MADILDCVTGADGDAGLVKILEDVCAITGMGFAAIAHVSETRWVAWQVLDRIEFGLNPGDELKIKTTICNDIRQSGNAVTIDSVADDWSWKTHPTPAMYGFQSYASFPIHLSDGTFFGTLCAIDPKPRTVSAPKVVAMLEQCAQRASKILSESASKFG